MANKLPPTGKPLDVIDGVEMSGVDVAMPIVMLRASGSREPATHTLKSRLNTKFSVSEIS